MLIWKKKIPWYVIFNSVYSRHFEYVDSEKNRYKVCTFNDSNVSVVYLKNNLTTSQRRHYSNALFKKSKFQYFHPYELIWSHFFKSHFESGMFHLIFSPIFVICILLLIQVFLGNKCVECCHLSLSNCDIDHFPDWFPFIYRARSQHRASCYYKTPCK